MSGRDDEGIDLPLYLIERNFAEALELNRDMVSESVRVNNDVDIRWIYSFLSVDKKKSYCLYEASSPEAIREAARRLNVPADEIIEIGSKVQESDFLAAVADASGD